MARGGDTPGPLSFCLVIRSRAMYSRRTILTAGVVAPAWPRSRPMPVTELSLRELSDRIRSKQVTPAQATKACLDRIHSVDRKLNAFITITAREAMEQAAALGREIESGRYRGPLHGIPIAIKDVIDTAGIRTTAGSRVFADRVPAADAEIVRRLRRAGAILLGKVNTSEFALADTSVLCYRGLVRNPWDLGRDAGGSSSGSGVAVAARLCYAAIGTDTGGSVRIPAARCAAVGLRPGIGRISTAGLVPAIPSCDTIGPLCRTAEDAAIVFEAISGISRPPQTNSPLRVGVPQDEFFDGLDRDVAAAMQAATRVIEKMSGKMQTVRVPAVPDIEIDQEIWRFHEALFAKRAMDYHPLIRERIRKSSLVTPDRYRKAVAQLESTRAHASQVFADVDVLVTPTTPNAAPTLEEARRQEEGHEFAASRNTWAVGVWGVPAVSLPCGYSGSGLPIGLQLIGAPKGEYTILGLAARFQRDTEWHLRSPAV